MIWGHLVRRARPVHLDVLFRNKCESNFRSYIYWHGPELGLSVIDIFHSNLELFTCKYTIDTPLYLLCTCTIPLNSLGFLLLLLWLLLPKQLQLGAYQIHVALHIITIINLKYVPQLPQFILAIISYYCHNSYNSW